MTIKVNISNANQTFCEDKVGNKMYLAKFGKDFLTYIQREIGIKSNKLLVTRVAELEATVDSMEIRLAALEP